MSSKNIREAIRELNSPTGSYGQDLFILALVRYLGKIIPDVLDSCIAATNGLADKVARNNFEVDCIASETFPDLCEVTLSSGFASGTIVRFPLASFEGDVCK